MIYSAMVQTDRGPVVGVEGVVSIYVVRDGKPDRRGKIVVAESEADFERMRPVVEAELWAEWLAEVLP